MNKITSVMAFAIVLNMASISLPTYAFDIGGAKDLIKGKGVVKSIECVGQAKTLATSGGTGVVKAFDLYSSDQSLSATDLGIATVVYNDLKKYISSGCAKDHLQTALSQLQ